MSTCTLKFAVLPGDYNGPVVLLHALRVRAHAAPSAGLGTTTLGGGGSASAGACWLAAFSLALKACLSRFAAAFARSSPSFNDEALAAISLSSHASSASSLPSCCMASM